MAVENGALGLGRASEQRAHACHELGEAERLDEVVVTTDVEPANGVELGVPRADEQDLTGVPDVAQVGSEVEAGVLAAGEHDVEDGEVERRRRQRLVRLLEVVSRDDVVASPPEHLHQRLGDVGLVFEQKYAHGLPLGYDR